MAAWRTGGVVRIRWDTRGTSVGEGRMVGSEAQVGRANRGCEGDSGGVVQLVLAVVYKYGEQPAVLRDPDLAGDVGLKGCCRRL